MEVSDDLSEMLDVETDGDWEHSHETTTVTHFEAGDYQLSVAAWDSNRLERWSVALRNLETGDFIPADGSAYTSQVVDTAQELIEENL
jgi:hypothetical protein